MIANGAGNEELRSLIADDPEQGLFRVNRAIFNDPEIFELELKRIFGRTWVYLAHESQIPHPNDFVTTYIGRVPVIVTRNKTGQVRTLINSCAHRGAMVCISRKGNAPVFTCGYHGWCYDSNGRNVAVRDREGGGYPSVFAATNHDLAALPKVGSYRGFIWGSLNPEVSSLEEYLGDTRVFIDLLVDQSTEGLEVLRGSSTYTYRGNWKLQAENGVDGYHFPIVHANWVRVIERRTRGGYDQVKAIDGANLFRGTRNGCYDLSNGHTLIWGQLPNPADRAIYERREELARRVGEVRADWITSRMRNVLIYPNVQLMDQASSQIRIFRPLAADLTQVQIYCIAPVGESAAARERRIRQYEDFFNASGMATPDDLAQFEACQEGYHGLIGRPMQEYERGVTTMDLGPNDEAAKLGIRPRTSGNHMFDETLYHGQYRQWLKLMQQEA